MKARILMTCLALLGVPALAAAQQSNLKFTSIPVVEKIGAGEHKLFPYRSEDKLVVIVQDPIVCGQKPVNPRYEVNGNRLTLRYDLTPVPMGVTHGACSAQSTFEINNVPHQDFEVAFAGGKEPFIVANMTRCPNTAPIVDIWDCLVPHK